MPTPSTRFFSSRRLWSSLAQRAADGLVLVDAVYPPFAFEFQQVRGHRLASGQVKGLRVGGVDDFDDSRDRDALASGGHRRQDLLFASHSVVDVLA